MDCFNGYFTGELGRSCHEEICNISSECEEIQQTYGTLHTLYVHMCICI